MAQAGDRLTSPVGQEIVFVQTAADTGGEVLVMETRLPAGGPLPPMHLHPAQEETFTVLEGTVNVVLGEERRTLHAGDVLVIPAGTAHAMNGDARMRWETRPALRTEDFFELIFGGGPPERLATVLDDFAAEFRLA
jgi:quercetin dioxygenase-like cupin family protein